MSKFKQDRVQEKLFLLCKKLVIGLLTVTKVKLTWHLAQFPLHFTPV